MAWPHGYEDLKVLLGAKRSGGKSIVGYNSWLCSTVEGSGHWYTWEMKTCFRSALLAVCRITLFLSTRFCRVLGTTYLNHYSFECLYCLVWILIFTSFVHLLWGPNQYPLIYFSYQCGIIVYHCPGNCHMRRSHVKFGRHTFLPFLRTLSVFRCRTLLRKTLVANEHMCTVISTQ